MSWEKIIEIIDHKYSFALFGTVAGLILNFLFNDYIRPFFSSVRTIRGRLQEKKAISKREEKRVLKYAKERLDEWINKFKSPNNATETEFDSDLISLPYNANNKTTKCPSSDNFLYFDSINFLDRSENEQDISYIIEKFESYLISSDSKDNISKQLFNNRYLNSKLAIWLRLPTYLVKSKETINELYNKIDTLIKSWFPNSSLKIEFFIPQLISPKSEKLDINESVKNSDFYYEAGRKTFLQDYATSVLKKKCVFGKLELDNEKRIPIELIHAKLPKQSILNSNQITEITGPPGSGKTEILDYIINNHVYDTDNTLIICFNSHDEISFLNAFYYKYDSFMNYLVEIIDLHEQFDCSEEELQIIRNIFKIILKKRLVKILFVIDNLEYSENLYSDIESFLSSNVFDNVSFLISSRYLSKKSKNNLKTTQFNSELWTYEESLKIVEHWNNNTECITNRLWLKANKSFSTYFLRIISSTDEDIEPDELVKKEIKSILSPILKSIDSTQLSSDDQIKMIKELLEKNKITKESIQDIFKKEKNLDIIKVFGNMTWSRIYNFKRDGIEEQYGLSTNIIPERVIGWSNNMIPDLETAKRFVKACKDSGIIKDYSHTDKLIQDGTAAITIQEEHISKYLLLESSDNYDPIELNKTEAIVHDLVTKLSKKNSLEIFKLSFRANHLVVIINSIINSERNKSLLDKLLSVDYIKYLSRNPKNIEIIAFNLIKAFDKKDLQINDKIYIGLCLSRMIDEDKNLKSFFNESINNNQKKDLISCVYSQYYRDDLKVFEYRPDQIETNLLFDFCCRTWTSKTGSVLVNKILELSKSQSPQKLVSSFTIWIKRQSTDEIIELCNNIFDSLPEKESNEKKTSIKLINKILEPLFSGRLAKADTKISYLTTFDKWRKQIKKYTFNRIIETSELIQILAYGYNHDLCDLNTDYKIIADKKNDTIFAIPKNQFKKEGIQSAFHHFKDTKYFELPSSELLAYVYKDIDGKELISDYLQTKGIKYVPFPKLYPNEHKYYKNKKIYGMNDEDIHVTKFGWRPVFKL